MPSYTYSVVTKTCLFGGVALNGLARVPRLQTGNFWSLHCMYMIVHSTISRGYDHSGLVADKTSKLNSLSLTAQLEWLLLVHCPTKQRRPHDTQRASLICRIFFCSFMNDPIIASMRKHITTHWDILFILGLERPMQVYFFLFHIFTASTLTIFVILFL